MTISKEDLDKESGKISGMFNGIAPRYDLLNHLLSFNIDKYWRSRMVRFLKQDHLPLETGTTYPHILDIACGTGDSTIALYKSGMAVTGVDIAEKMMEIAKEKNNRLTKNKIVIPLPEYILGSAESLPFPDNSFDGVTISFGIRNFNRRPQCLQEIHRVIKPGGTLAILEFAKPRNPVIRWSYNTYFNNILPFVGDLLSKDKGAYKYLAESVEQFPKYDAFCKELQASGFLEVEYQPYTFGVAILYSGKKQLNKKM